MKKSLFIFLVSSMLLLTSCLASDKVMYVKDMVPDTAYPTMEAPSLRIQKNDRLSIVVNSKIPELAVPFNQGVGSYQVNERGEVITSTSSLSSKGYLVNEQGEIEFPILGSLALEGMTLEEAKDMIKSRLINDNLIGEPLVQVELLNLKINMMGEIGAVGILNVPDGKITLLEAISRSGGLTRNSSLDKIAVIREENGERKMYLNNIETLEIFNSPTFYLQQNDIVYIEPRTATSTIKEDNTWRYIGAGIGLFGTIFSILNFIK